MINEEALKDFLTELTYCVLILGSASKEDRTFFNEKLEKIFIDSESDKK